MHSYAWVVVILIGGTAFAAEVENPLAARLLAEGVVVGTDQVAPLPPPLLTDGMDAAAQRRAIAGVVGELGMPEFLRNSPVASHKLVLESLKDTQGQRLGQRVDLYFVAYGRLATLTDQGLLGEIAGLRGQNEPADAGDDPEANVGHTLTPDELSSRGIVPHDSEGLSETFSYFDVPILERLRLGGVAQAVHVSNDRWLLAAARLDERFANDPQYSNRWRPITRNDLGQPIVGAAEPYAGLGGYIKVTPLAEPAGALFIEVHGVFNEPTGWFGGQNYLGSKLPFAVRDNVKNFRTRLAKAEAAAP